MARRRSCLDERAAQHGGRIFHLFSTIDRSAICGAGGDRDRPRRNASNGSDAKPYTAACPDYTLHDRASRRCVLDAPSRLVRQLRPRTHSRTSVRRTTLFFFPRDHNVCRVLVSFANDHSNASALASGEAAFTRSAHSRHREDDNVTTLGLSHQEQCDPHH